jgi:hypothetical protein
MDGKHMELNARINYFEEDLAWSEEMGRWSFYLKVLHYFFPGAKEWKRVLGLLAQKKGRDLYIDEYKIQIKARRVFYGDICIEWRHDWFNGNFGRGWIDVYEDVDYIIYIIESVTLAYKIDFQTLKIAWENNKQDWIEKYDLKPARNLKYDTRNCGVPISVLIDAGVIIEKYLVTE